LMAQTEEDQAKSSRSRIRPIVGIAIVSLVVCGVLFPLVITGLGQTLFPNQANGDLVTLHGCTVGSNLVAQNFNKTVFFYPRPSSQSASGVDPDITLQNATAQVPRISNATGLPTTAIENVVNNNIEGTFWIFGTPYVNVLRLNTALINAYPRLYGAYLPKGIADGNCTSS
jgi:K+-transporting ATPase ATPase C chain